MPCSIEVSPVLLQPRTHSIPLKTLHAALSAPQIQDEFTVCTVPGFA